MAKKRKPQKRSVITTWDEDAEDWVVDSDDPQNPTLDEEIQRIMEEES